MVLAWFIGFGSAHSDSVLPLSFRAARRIVTNKAGCAGDENFHGRLILFGGQSIVGRETNDTLNVSTVVPAKAGTQPNPLSDSTNCSTLEDSLDATVHYLFLN